MFRTNPALRKDFYKVGHPFQYEQDTEVVYSNLTARKSRLDYINYVIPFGFQAYVFDKLVDDWKTLFFDKPRADVVKEYKRRIVNALGPISVKHIESLHEVGYLPVRIKAVPEGLRMPMRVPLLTIVNTLREFFWVTNMLETNMSQELWGPITSATIAFHYRKVFEEYAKLTGGSRDFVKWQGHDFSARGMWGEWASAASGAAHLLSFTGTDSITAIDFLEEFYGADCEQELIGGSVPATEHSVMCMGLKTGEEHTFTRLLDEVYPKGIVSVVSDTWDFWYVLLHILPKIKPLVMKRDGKLVIRPDSGDPTKIICGDPSSQIPWIRKGAIEMLWDIFGGTTNAAGFKELDSHIGLIYGDSITPERQHDICEGLKVKGFASTNVVFGIGSFTYTYCTRDTFGLAVKATYGETKSRGPQAIFKDPKTDDGTKRSATGLLKVYATAAPVSIVCQENCTWAQEAEGLLQPIFIDGKIYNFQPLVKIRNVIDTQIQSMVG